ncbi:MAG TPA: hypothetical protein PKM32_06340, partial [Planctomycetota bacterium]|nr:hypothetical protein [Planctomycetota bacterium]
RKHVVFICGLFCILFLCHISTPSNAYTLYPWWLIPTLLYIFAYIFFRYYFYKKHSLRRPFLVLFYMCDTLLFIPCTFLIYTMGVQWNIFQPPVHFEKNICQPSQMIVFQNSLFTAYTKPIIQKKQNKIDTKRTFQSWKRNFQFQLRLLERTTKTTTSLYVWLQDQKHPETQQQFENMVQELKLYYSQYAQKTKKILENKNKTWMWTAQEKSIQKYIQEFQSTDYFPIQIISKPVPPPLMQLYIKNKQLYIYWKEQNIYYKYNIPDIEYHNITYNIVGKTYTIHIHRYPGIKNIYIEQALQQAKNDTIQPIETDMPDSFTKYTNLFFRPSLLGTKGGVRNQDIFLRHVAAFQETYCKTTIPIILFLLCLLASWPILYLLPQVPKWITTLCQTITTLLKYTTAIPIYVIIAIIFIGIYDGKNFHILFTLVGYFLLPNLTQQIYRSVQTYKETYYPTKISLGFSPIMIAYHFITREARQLYIIYLLYFCANMILFETSFAYLKGGSPSELSLGIFLYASRNQWTMETYATIIILVSILYFFSRSTLFFRQENI